MVKYRIALMNKKEPTEIAINFATTLFSKKTTNKTLDSLCNDASIIHKVNTETTTYSKRDLQSLINGIYIPLTNKYTPSNFKAIKTDNNTIELEANLKEKPYLCKLTVSITFDDTNCKIKMLETCLIKKLTGLSGGIFSFSLDSNFSLIALTEGIVDLLEYENKYALIKSCSGKLANLLEKKNLELLLKTIKDVRTKDRSFTIPVILKNKSLKTISMYLKGQIIKVAEGKEEVLAQLIVKEIMDDDVEFYDSSKLQFTELVQNQPTPLFFKNRKGIYKLINLAYIKEFEIKNMMDMLNHNDSAFFKTGGVKFVNSDEDIFNKKIAFNESINYLTIDDKKFYCITYKIPIYYKDEITGILGFVSNITKETEYKQKLHMKDIETDYIFSNSESPYYIKDNNLRFIKANNKFCSIFQIEEELLLNKTIEEILPHYVVDPTTKFDLKALNLKKGESIKDTFELDFNNKLKYYEIKITPMFDENNKIYRLIGKFEDITQLIEKENKLIKSYNLELDQNYCKKTLDYIRIDIETGAILFSKKNCRFDNSKYFNDKLMDRNIGIFLYNFEFIDFKEKYSIKALRKNIEHKKISSLYTLKIKSKIIQIEVNLEYYTNPTTRHKEAVLRLTDISKSIQNKELIELFGKAEFDFIVKLSFLAGYATCKYNNGREFKFDKLKNDHSIKSFLSILYKDSITPVPTVAEWKSLVEQLLKNEKHNTYFIETKSDRRKNISVKAINNKKQTIFVASQDFTETTKKDRAIQKQLRQLAQDAQRADNVKTEFLSRMSHDMRTPLTAILALTDFGIEESNESLSINYFNKIKSSSQYLSILLNDVLEIQKIESGEIVLNNKPFYLPHTAEHIKTMVYPRTIEKNINLEIIPINQPKDSIYVNNDEVRMSEILVNILNNAIKYTPNGGQITWIFELKRNPLVLHNTIIDNGIGISKDFQKKMFNKYTQEQNIFSGAEGGSGLGLSIVKNLVNLVDGTIKCESKLNEGTTFTIDLPLNKTTKAEYEKYHTKKPKISLDILSNKHILVCEDTKINTVIIDKILSKYGITIDIAENGQIGVNKAKQNKYDAILMDIRMPIMNGLESAKEIRKFDDIIPIIALSANAYKEDIEKSLKAGMNAHLSKPIDVEILFNTLALHLS
jgi:PAS domain S-box-containing protein